MTTQLTTIDASLRGPTMQFGWAPSFGLIRGTIIAAVVLVVLLLYILLQSRRRDDSVSETVDGVGDTTQGFVGGVLGSTRALVLSLLAIFATVFAELGALVGDISSSVASGPLFVGHMAYGAATMVGLGFGLDRSQFAVAFVSITLIALIWGGARAANRRRSFG
jgi:hypothetical protein